MGGAQSTCGQNVQNPDLLNVVTLSDAAVQRLPMEDDNGPLDKEQRNKNIDDFWRERMKCLDDTFDQTKCLTERDFSSLEKGIKRMAPGKGSILCPRVVEDTTTCYLINEAEPLSCSHLVKKLKLCMDTLMAESSKKQYMDDKRKARRKTC